MTGNGDVTGLFREVTEVAVNVSGSAVGLMQSERAELANCAVGAVYTAGRADLNQSGGVVLAAGNDMSVTQGGAWLMGAGNRIDVHEGGAMVMATGTANVTNGNVGVLLAGKAMLEGEVRVLLGTPQAIALGAAFGLTLALALQLFGRSPNPNRP